MATVVVALHRLAQRLLGVCCVLVALGVMPSLADVVTRKNIDDLTPQELAAFEHAIQIMKDRSAANPYDKSGYLWQAWVHNCPSTWVPKDGQPDGRAQCDFWSANRNTPPDTGRDYERQFPGMCEHGKDLFLTWHRAQFYFFEKILQETDPDGNVTDSRGVTGPSTKNVGVPFWNWTRRPSGVRYPRAMEDPRSPLFHANRNHAPVLPGEYPFTSPLLVGYMINYLDWPAFGGYEKAQQGGYGRFERESHNPMHSQYFGGDMASPSTAALDPGFFPFHAYIDLLLEQWMERHDRGTITSMNAFLRADQPDTIARPVGYRPGAPGSAPDMGQPHLYLDTRSLGYEYKVLPADEPMDPAVIARLIEAEVGQPAVFGTSLTSLTSLLLTGGRFGHQTNPDIVRTVDLRIPDTAPAAGSHAFQARFDRNPMEPDVSYQMDVYIYPVDAPFDPAGKAFTAKYLAGIGVYWGTGHGGEGHMPMHGASHTFNVDVTDAVADLARTGRSGETWRMSMAITVLPIGETFGRATLESTAR